MWVMRYVNRCMAVSSDPDQTDDDSDGIGISVTTVTTTRITTQMETAFALMKKPVTKIQESRNLGSVAVERPTPTPIIMAYCNAEKTFASRLLANYSSPNSW